MSTGSHPCKRLAPRLARTGLAKARWPWFSPHVDVIIHHDFLPLPMRSSHAKSDNTHTIIYIHPLAHIHDTYAMIFSSLKSRPLLT